VAALAGPPLLAALAAAVALLGLGLRRPRARALVLLGACAAEPALVHQRLNPTAPPELYAYRPPVADALKVAPGARVYVFEYDGWAAQRWLGRSTPYVTPLAARRERVPWQEQLAIRTYPPPPVPSLWRVEGSFDSDAFGALPVDRTRFVYALHDAEGTPAHLRLLQLGAVQRMAALHRVEGLPLVAELPTLLPDPVRVYDIPGALPRALVVGGTRVVPAPRVIETLLEPGFDPWTEIVVAEGQPAEPSRAGEAHVVGRRADRVVVEVVLDRPGHLLLMDAYDAGWKATVDGTAQPVVRANGIFMGVALEAGRHRVELRYRPRAVLVGLALSVVTAFVVMGLAARGRR
jgi:hypothetical protein